MAALLLSSMPYSTGGSKRAFAFVPLGLPLLLSVALAECAAGHLRSCRSRQTCLACAPHVDICVWCLV